MSVLILDIETLDEAETRDLANALLRAAWSAALEAPRIMLLEASEKCDAVEVGA